MKSFLATYLAPSRSVLVGVNVAHDELLAAASKADWGTDSPASVTKADYVAGMFFNPRVLVDSL